MNDGKKNTLDNSYHNSSNLFIFAIVSTGDSSIDEAMIAIVNKNIKKFGERGKLLTWIKEGEYEVVRQFDKDRVLINLNKRTQRPKYTVVGMDEITLKEGDTPMYEPRL